MRWLAADLLRSFCYEDQRHSSGRTGAGWRTRRVKGKNPCGSRSTAGSSSSPSEGGLLAHRELDDALDLTAKAASALAERRRGRNIRHQLADHPVPAARPLAASGLRPARRLRGCQRRPTARPRSRHARHRRPREHGSLGGLEQRDGPVRDRVARDGIVSEGAAGQPGPAQR
jgi:hypothetical protein